MRILIVEDDPGIANVIRRGLIDQHYSVDIAEDGELGLDLALCNDYDLVILDILLPKLDGRSLLKQLREAEFSPPVLMLTALDSPDDVVAALDLGADDYLSKPFDFNVLLARVRSLTRRRSNQRTARIEVGGLVLDTAHRTAMRDSVTLNLTSKEFALLEYFVMNQRKNLTRDEISEHVWDINFDPRSNVIESLVRFLRQKIDIPSGMSLIKTVRGIGYRFESDE
jgi:DNA-binding response OmpR family regulator